MRRKIVGDDLIRLTYEEIAYHNTLAERDIAIEPRMEKKDWGDMYYCQRCGKSVGKDDRFCSSCGQRLEE